MNTSLIYMHCIITEANLNHIDLPRDVSTFNSRFLNIFYDLVQCTCLLFILLNIEHIVTLIINQ